MTATPGLIDDFLREHPETAIGTRWQLLSDAVMGGVSAGRMARTEHAGRHAIRMQGEVSLENNGGFLQIALDLAPDGGSFDASGFTGVAIVVAGNGEEYGLHLRTSELTRPWQSYRTSFVARPDWQDIRFPFAGFVAHRTETPLNLRLLRRLGIVAIGRAFAADVAVGGLHFYRAGPDAA